MVHVAIADIVFCNTILLWLNVIKKMKITAICTMFDAVFDEKCQILRRKLISINGKN